MKCAAKKILVIDDEKDLITLISARLKGHGFEVVSALEGPTGIRKAIVDRPDLIILDLMMPEMDGYEVARRLAGDPVTSTIPVIVLTAAVGPDLGQKVSEVKAADYLTKPFKADELLEKIKRTLSLATVKGGENAQEDTGCG